LEIADWLRGLSLERYAETFRDNASNTSRRTLALLLRR